MFFVVPTFLSFTILLGVGPYLQQTIGSALISQAPTLYASVFGEGLVIAPPFLEWLLVGFELPLVVPALITTLVAVSAPTYIMGALRAAVAAFVTISLSDTVSYFLHPKASDLSQAILFNGIGGMFVFFYFGILFLIYDNCKVSWRGFIKPKFSYPSLAVLFAVGVSLGVFLLFQLFFTPNNSTEFRAIANFPTSGDMVTGNDKAKADEPKKRGLSAFPENRNAGKFDFFGSGKEIEANWERLDDNAKFFVRISAYADCLYPQDLEKLPPARHFLEVQPTKVELKMSDGLVGIITAHKGAREYNLIPASVFSYWFKTKESGTLNAVEAFIEPRDRISVNPSGGLKFFLGGQLFKVEGNTHRSNQRRLTLSINGNDYHIVAGGKRKYKKNKVVECSALSKVELEHHGDDVQVVVPNAEYLSSLGLLVELIEEPVELDAYNSNSSRLTFSNAGGFARFHDIDVVGTVGGYLGHGRGLSIEKNLSRLQVDGSEVAVTKTDHLFVVADVNVYYEPTYLEARGKAKALWLNDRRLNTTIWERLSEGWQLFIITAALGLLSFLVRKLIPAFLHFIREDKAFNV